MEPERSLPHSQMPVTRPYPQPARSNPYPHIPLREDPFRSGSPKWSLSHVLSTSFHHGNTDEQYLRFGQYCSIHLFRNKIYLYLAPIRILAKSLYKTVQVRRTHMQWNRDTKISKFCKLDAQELSVELAATEDKCQTFTLQLQRT